MFIWLIQSGNGPWNLARDRRFLWIRSMGWGCKECGLCLPHEGVSYGWTSSMSALQPRRYPRTFRDLSEVIWWSNDLNRLLELDQQHHSSRPLLTSDGRIRLRNPSTGTTEVGIQWSELLERAPQYFSLRYDRIRAREEYGKAVHGEIARIARQLAFSIELLQRVCPMQNTSTGEELLENFGFLFRLEHQKPKLFGHWNRVVSTVCVNLF